MRNAGIHEAVVERTYTPKVIQTENGPAEVMTEEDIVVAVDDVPTTDGTDGTTANAENADTHT